MKKNHEIDRFILIDHADPQSIPAGGAECICLYEFANIAAREFIFPFSGISRVKEALRFRFRPLLGETAGDVSIVPFFVKNEKRSSAGCVFLLSGASDEDAGTLQNIQGAGRAIWPAPLVFAAEIEGSGVVAFTGSRYISTVWLDDWVPRFYSVCPIETGNVDQELEMAQSYAESQGAKGGKLFSADSSTLSGSDYTRFGRRTIAECPSYANLDLSDRGADLLEKRERMFATFARYGRYIAVTGVLLLAAALGAYMIQDSAVAGSAAATEEIYFRSFGERSKQPLNSARAKLYSSDPQRAAETSLIDVLRAFSFAWDEMGVPEDITIESMRYGPENTDITGTSSNNESIQKLRAVLESDGFSPKIDNIQRVPSGELRFNMSVTKGTRPQ